LGLQPDVVLCRRTTHSRFVAIANRQSRPIPIAVNFPQLQHLIPDPLRRACVCVPIRLD